MVRADPLNCEVRIGRLVKGAVTPNDRFYIRSHFPTPAIDPRTWRLRVHGLVERELSLDLDDVRKMPSMTQTVTLECAGNGRTLFTPAIEGEPWTLGAVSTATWRGVLLSHFLAAAGVRSGATHLVFRGAEGFERGLSLDEAAKTVLAHEMNGEPLPAEHGSPLRAVVPGWYAVASVKWLTEIEVTDRPFDGYYQTQRYVYAEGEPVTRQKVRSLIVAPTERARLAPGRLEVRGVAWSGAASISRVDVRVGDEPWTEAQLIPSDPDAWTLWRLTTRAVPPGRVTLQSRATDATGATQPEQAEWNRLGYGNNSIQKVTVEVA